jgi:hypothetical protein
VTIGPVLLDLEEGVCIGCGFRKQIVVACVAIGGNISQPIGSGDQR